MGYNTPVGRNPNKSRASLLSSSDFAIALPYAGNRGLSAVPPKAARLFASRQPPAGLNRPRRQARFAAVGAKPIQEGDFRFAELENHVTSLHAMNGGRQVEFPHLNEPR
jgi:hypothetical protein